MIRFATIALLLVGCGIEQPPMQCTEDPWLPQWIESLDERKPYEVQACPAGMPIHYRGTGCVQCDFWDVCGADYTASGCSPAPKVYCWEPGIACPIGYDAPVDKTVTQWSEP